MFNKLGKKIVVSIVSLAMMAGVVGVGIAPGVVSAQTVAPVGYEKISGPSQIYLYTDVIKYPDNPDLYGKPRSVTPTPTTVKVTTQASTATTNSGILGTGGSSLGNLLILDRVFGGNGNLLGDSSTDGTTAGTGNSLGNLFLLSELFGGNSSNIFGTGTVSASTGSMETNLGQMLILDRIFGGDNMGVLGADGSSLGNLFLLNKLFN